MNLEVADWGISGAAMEMEWEDVTVAIGLVQPGDLPGLLPLISGRIDG